MDNLPELRDIHLPSEGISIFPLAPGWWLLTLLIVAVIAFFVLRKYMPKVKMQSKKIYAVYLLKKTENADNLASAIQMSELLRRVCIAIFPQAVALSGKEWIDFLNSKSAMKLEEKTADLLKNAPYIPEAESIYTSENVADLRKFCYKWIGDNL